ncbi:MAG: InlB B-repeat-containing protein [Clostridia bacterium]|nr:InlB B-repeat-containing protein [Clostridia bacterium]
MKKFIKYVLITLSAISILAACFAFLGCNDNQEEQGKQEEETFVDYTLNSLVCWVSGQDVIYVDANNMTSTDHFNYDAIIQSYGTKVSISEKEIEFVNGTVLSYYGKTGYLLDDERVVFFEPALEQTFNYARLSNGVFLFGIQIEVSGMTVTYYFEYYSPNAITPTYQVKFDSQGGSIVAPITILKGYAATKPTNPTKTGYTFVGWYIDEKCTVAWNFSTKIYMDTVLYAKWSANYNDVKFNSNGGTNVNTWWIKTGDTVPKPSDPTKTGYTFAGWYADSFLKTPYDFSTEVNSDMTLYAKWTPKTYTITFDANGGTCSVQTKTVTFDTRISLPTPTAPEGKKFDGWFYADDNGYGHWFESGSMYYDVPYSITLHAVWTNI